MRQRAWSGHMTVKLGIGLVSNLRGASMKIKSILLSVLLMVSVSALASPPFRMQFGQGANATDVTATNPLPSAAIVGGAAVSSTNPLPTVIYGTNGLTPSIITVYNGVTGVSVVPAGGKVQAISGVSSNSATWLVGQTNTQGTYQQATIAPAATVATLTPPANNALGYWDISITSNATLAVAGTDTITVALNGVTLYKTSVYIPATALSSTGQMYSHKEKYSSFVVPKVGSAGTFTVTLGTALATGTVNVNEYSGD